MRPAAPSSRFTVQAVLEDDPKEKAIHSNSVITPTFVCPGDLPEEDFRLRLNDLGACLESVCVDADERAIRGRIAVRDAADSSAPQVAVLFSRDGWRTRGRASCEKADAEGSYSFAVDASDMRIGDDLELRVAVDDETVDDNCGSSYRLICKTRPRFQPGKSLW